MYGIGMFERVRWLEFGSVLRKEVGRLLLRFVARRLDDKGWEVLVKHLESIEEYLASLTSVEYCKLTSKSEPDRQVVCHEQVIWRKKGQMRDFQSLSSIEHCFDTVNFSILHARIRGVRLGL